MPKPVGDVMLELDGKQIYLVDDDAFFASVLEKYLLGSGADVRIFTDSREALDQTIKHHPDCVVTDLMMPNLDGYELCTKLRKQPLLEGLKIIVASAKGFEFDRRRARQVGADGYLVKPIDKQTFLDELERTLSPKLDLQYWGVHGTLPAPGPKTVRYGGNTSCVSVVLPDKTVLVFDAGSGIKPLGDHLMAGGGRINAKIFITHPHWDHINALPFFVPLYVQGNSVEILGPGHGDVHMRDLISAQMDSLYFPITMDEFGAAVTFRDLREETIAIDGVTISSMLLSHPGNCLGYRLGFADKSICYITDNELFPDRQRALPGRPAAAQRALHRALDRIHRRCRCADHRHHLPRRRLHLQGRLGPFLRQRGRRPGPQGPGQGTTPVPPRPQRQRRHYRSEVG